MPVAVKKDVRAPEEESRSLLSHLYRLSVDQYHRLAEVGILTEGDRVELLEGLLVAKVTHNPPHDGTILALQSALLRVLPPDWVLRIQSSLTLSDSEPEPDLAVARGPLQRYFRSHPRPADLGLVIEVADASLEQDHTDKTRIYARARLPIYWLANLRDLQIEVYTLPRAGRAPTYRQRQDYHLDQTIPLILDGVEIAQLPVRELLPDLPSETNEPS